MKQTIKNLLFALLLVACFACDNDDDELPVPVNLRLEKLGTDTYSYDAEGRIYKITDQMSEKKFTYEGSRIVTIYGYITDPMIADGGSIINFEYEGDKIIVKKWFEPAIDQEWEEIELDADGQLKRVTELGFYEFSFDTQDWQKMSEGHAYTIFSYDALNRLRATQTFRLADDTLIDSTTFEYDESNGMLLGVASPGPWLFTYRAFTTYYRIPFLNTTHNVTRITSQKPVEGASYDHRFTYTYNEDNYPSTYRMNDWDTDVTAEYERRID